MTAQFRIGGAPLGASCTAGDKFYDRMSEALGLPTVASADEWREMGRDIASCGIPRTVWGGVVVYGLEATFVPLGVAEEAPTPPEVAEAVQFLAGRMEARKAAANTTERVRPPLTWATPKPVDRWEGYAVKSGKYCGHGPNEFMGGSPLQRMTDPSDPAHGSAWLKVR